MASKRNPTQQAPKQKGDVKPENVVHLTDEQREEQRKEMQKRLEKLLKKHPKSELIDALNELNP